MARVFVCKDGELKDGDVRIVSAGTSEIGVYRHAGQYYAYRNHCVHQGGPACEGVKIGKVVEILNSDRGYAGEVFDDSDPHIVCPWHGWEYRLLTGENAVDPKIKLKRYEVVHSGGVIYVDA
jgi:nitrite reductase (NADH) small subunit